jgi:1-acyl-sn-glycerol-3-phosphate acyltransferase
MPLPPLKNPSRLLTLARGIALGVPVALFLLVTLMTVNCAQLLFLIIVPFSKKTYLGLNRWAANWWFGLCVKMGRGVHGVSVKLTGDPVQNGENAILVVNHQEMTDIVFLFMVAQAGGRLGDLKWFVKDQIKYVPGVGWGLFLLDNLFVKRRWSSDKNSIEAVFARLKRNGIPFWLVLFAEGTRITEEKLVRSRRIASKKKMKPLSHLLIPHTKGFVASLQGLGDRLDSVYDITIGYEKGVPSLVQYVVGFVERAHVHVRRFDAKELPAGHQALSLWLNQRFEEKDALLDEFFSQGAF